MTYEEELEIHGEHFERKSSYWNEEAYGMEDILNIMEYVREAQDEIESSCRGTNTECKTYKELADHIKHLGKRLIETAHALDFITETE